MAPVPKPKRQRQKHFLKEWRDYLNLTQEAAADRIGVTQSKLSRIEGYKSPYDQDFLEEAAIAYGVSPASLIMRNPFDDGAVWSLQEQLARATPEKRQQVLDVADVILKTGTH